MALGRNLGAIAPAEQAVIDAVPASIAVLDDRGVVIAVNRAWADFAHCNGRADVSSDIGREYVETIIKPAGLDVHRDPAIAKGIRRVVARVSSRFTTVYNCPGPRGDQWFRMVVLRAGAVTKVQRVLVVHRQQADAPTPDDIAPVADELALRWVGLKMRCAWCGEKVRDEMGLWVEGQADDVGSLTLSHGVCPDCYDAAVRAEGLRAT